MTDEVVDDGSENDNRWTLTDHLNSVRDLVVYNPVTGTVSVVKHVAYDAFGNVTSDSAIAVKSLFLYTARPFDADTDLQNNLNRWYDLSTGRWMSVDPIGFEAGDVNLYRYVGNAPSTAVDPRGLQECIYLYHPPGDEPVAPKKPTPAPAPKCTKVGPRRYTPWRPFWIQITGAIGKGELGVATEVECLYARVYAQNYKCVKACSKPKKHVYRKSENTRLTVSNLKHRYDAVGGVGLYTFKDSDDFTRALNNICEDRANVMNRLPPIPRNARPLRPGQVKP